MMEVSSATAAARKMTEQAMEDLVGAVEAGTSDRLKTYLAMLGRFHRYSLGNVILIAAQFPAATLVAGYRRWQELGRQVRRSERAIRILAPIIWRRKKHETEATASEKRERGDEERPVAFRSACVFDVTQTDGEPLPQFAQVGGDPGEAAQRLKRLVAGRGIDLQYSDALSTASGYSAGGRIVLKRGMTPAEEFSTMVHELAHEMLHQAADRAQDKKVRETEAEAIAFAVCQGVGLDANTASSDYIQLYQGDKETLLASLEEVRDTTHEILDAVLPGERPWSERQQADEQLRHEATASQ